MIFDIVLGVFLLLSPIFILIGNNARINGIFGALQYYQSGTLSLTGNALQFQFFEYGIIVLFIISLAQKQARRFRDNNVAWFLGLCAFSVFLHPKTVSAFIPVFLGVMFYCLIVKYTKNIKALLYAIIIVSALNTLFSILQSFGIYWLYGAPENRNICGMMFSSSHLGAYQALAFPICYAVNPLLSIILLVGLILSKSFTPMVALLVGMVYLWLPQRKKIFINLAPMGLMVLFGVFIVFIARNFHGAVYKLTLKFGLWFAVLREILIHPSGHGLGTFSILSPKFYTNLGHWEWAYNEYLGIAFYAGILALFFVLMFLKNKFNKVGEGLQRAVAASCLIIAVICLGQSSLHFPRLAGTIIPMFAFLDILKRKENDENKI